MPEIMTRWLRGYRGHRAAVKRVAHRLLQEYIGPSPLQEDFTWPDIIEQRQTESEHKASRPDNCKEDDNGLFFIDGRLWVPDEGHELQWKLLITAHCTYAGHRGIDATRSLLHEEFICSSLNADNNAFVPI